MNTTESPGCTCCQVRTSRPGAGDAECPKCGHLMSSHYRTRYADGEVIEYTSFAESGWTVGQVVSYSPDYRANPPVYIRTKSGGKPFTVRESQLRKHEPERREADAARDHLRRCSDPFCAACLAQIAANEADDGGDDVTDALAGDELMAWRMTPRTQQVILAALEVASRLPAQRAECERVAAIVRSAGGIHCPDCGPDRYGKHGIGHAFSETGGE